jgi:hypothetical protein
MWNVEVGLHLYTEPLSTALVTVAIALLLRPTSSDLTVALSGLALGYATTVKLTNGLIAAGLVIVVAAAGRRRVAGILTAAGLVFAPLLAVHWSKGYVGTYDGAISASDHPFGLEYVVPAWTDSLLFTPVLLTVLVLPALVGFRSLAGAFPRAAIGVPIAVTVVAYSFYDASIPASCTSLFPSCSCSLPQGSSPPSAPHVLVARERDRYAFCKRRQPVRSGRLGCAHANLRRDGRRRIPGLAPV